MTELLSDSEFLQFAQPSEFAVVIVMKATCGACIRFKEEHLEGVKRKFLLEHTPLGLVDKDVLSPEMQRNQNMIPYYPAIWLWYNGKPVTLYEGDRSPNAFADWVHKEVAERRAAARASQV